MTSKNMKSWKRVKEISLFNCFYLKGSFSDLPFRWDKTGIFSQLISDAMLLHSSCWILSSFCHNSKPPHSPQRMLISSGHVGRFQLTFKFMTNIKVVYEKSVKRNIRNDNDENRQKKTYLKAHIMQK